MTSIKIKFRESKVKQREGTLYYQILHNRIARQITTTYKIYSHEWCSSTGSIIFESDDTRSSYLQKVKSSIVIDINRLKEIILSLEDSKKDYITQDVVSMFKKKQSGEYFNIFASSIIKELKELGKERTSENYLTTVNSFMRFCQREDVTFNAIDSHLMRMYESFLKKSGVTYNTISFYMRIMRAIYNRAVDIGIVEQKYPFKSVYTGIDKTVKRAISVKYLKRLKELNLSNQPNLMIVRDLFLFSFYTRGMSFIDMAYLRKKDLTNGILTYRRRKTNKQMQIKWEVCMQEIIERYDTSERNYLLPIIKKKSISDHNQYRNSLISFNKRLKKLGEMVGITTVSLTMYVARHSWASIARNNNIPISVISEGMGHDSEATTQIYLASLDSKIIDKANNLILKLL